MTDPQHDFWSPLLASPGGGVPVALRLLSKGGRPFLALPAAARPALAVLTLYPAQSARARAAKRILGWLIRCGVSAGTMPARVMVDPGDPFIACLASVAGLNPGAVPACGILAGNPGSAGRRFVVLLFDRAGRPAAVVKAGLTSEARALIRTEASFLDQIVGRLAGIPVTRTRFEGERATALALDFFPGGPTLPDHEASLPALLRPWVDRKRTLPIESAPEWRRLAAVAATDRLWPGLAAAVRGRAVHPAVTHGDLTPWNIRVSPGGVWTVLDWERGVLDGIPAWDWFHYLVQVAILVERRNLAGLVDRAEELLAAPAFRQYAAEAGITGCERELFLAYLLHSVEVIRPTEGRAITRELLNAMAAR